jgi:16S rRNA processing protein RimM
MSVSGVSEKPTENWTAIGRLWRTRGKRGELTGELDSDQPDREKKLTEVALEVNGRRRIVQVEDTWRHGNTPIFKFQGMDSISEAEEWEGAEILVRESDLVLPGEDEYPHSALIGSEVLDGANGNRIGVVKSIEEYGGPPTLKVAGAGGKEILIPFARAICKEIDVAAKVIRVELPEGLLDL